MSKPNDQSKPTVLDACPHCGAQLSPWQQVLLSVDRALMCKNCWYRIVLDASDTHEDKKDESSPSKETRR